jgi:photosystem II stability/assembly factor-like uncharacterized protein
MTTDTRRRQANMFARLRYKGKRRLSAGLAAVLVLSALGMRPSQKNSPGSSDALTPKGKWIPVSEGLLNKLAEEGKKPSWPGGTAGVSVDRLTGHIRILVPDQGVWQSADQGATFVRVDGGRVGGRCETGFSLHADPAGRRLACFMLDGSSALTLDDGKTWKGFQPQGRGWDFGAVDWSRPDPKYLLAVHHESGGELYRSADGGKSWNLLGKAFSAVGLFDASAFVASQGEGILRSADGGATWTKVSERTPTGRVLCVFKGVGYWVTQEGLLVSKDNGLTWKLQRSPVEAAWGPYFGKDEKQMVVVGKIGKEIGFWQTGDAGKTWQCRAPFPDVVLGKAPDWTPSKQWGAGWFFTFGWSPAGNTLYASRMGHPTYGYSL